MTDVQPRPAPRATHHRPPGHYGRQGTVAPRPLRRGGGIQRESSGSVWGMLVIIAFLIVFILYASQAFSDFTSTLDGIFMIPICVLVAAPFVRKAAAEERSFDLRSIMYLGLAMRMIGAFYRFNTGVDATTYHNEGVKLADSFRQLQFNVDTGRQIPGTGFLRYVSGLVHVVVLDDAFASFLVFTLFSFVGCWFFYRAFTVAFPEGDRRRYALLLFLWPSLCYWPNSIGKESWMILGIGIASWGAAHLFAGRISLGVVGAALGLVTALMVRPHVALILFMAMFAALLMRRNTSSKTGMFAKLFALVLLLGIGLLIYNKTTAFFKVDDLGAEGVGSTLSGTEDQTTQGGSAFAAAVVRTPLDYPKAFVTVLFRPFPFEVRPNINNALAVGENLFLVALFITGWRRLRHLPSLMRRVPYVTYAIVFVLVFVYAFSSIGNFGILARQRTQVDPLLLVLVSLPVVLKPKTRDRSDADYEPDPIQRRWRKRLSHDDGEEVAHPWRRMENTDAEGSVVPVSAEVELAMAPPARTLSPARSTGEAQIRPSLHREIASVRLDTGDDDGPTPVPRRYPAETGGDEPDTPGERATTRREPSRAQAAREAMEAAEAQGIDPVRPELFTFPNEETHPETLGRAHAQVRELLAFPEPDPPPLPPPPAPGPTPDAGRRRWRRREADPSAAAPQPPAPVPPAPESQPPAAPPAPAAGEVTPVAPPAPEADLDQANAILFADGPLDIDEPTELPDPAPTDPAPTDPAPTDPAPAEPAAIANLARTDEAPGPPATQPVPGGIGTTENDLLTDALFSDLRLPEDDDASGPGPPGG